MAISSPASPAFGFDLNDVLERLGLTEYSHVLSDNGFHNWDTVVDITEEDLTALHFKLGHRRALQREIATFRGLPSTISLEPETTATTEPTCSTTSLSTSALETLTRQTSTPPREKRRYRRHPRADSNAPKKPKTAYVNFSDWLRTDPVVSQLSFTAIAKEVGKRWAELPLDQKREWESNAARAMQEFEARMDDYKKTDSYRRHQNYLNDFKTQQARLNATKRPNASRSTTDSSNNTRVMSRGSPTSSASPTSASLPEPSGIEVEVCYDALTLAFSELVTLRGEILNQGIRPYDAHNLPAEELMRRSMYAFIRGTGSLLYMFTSEQVDDLLDKIYRPQGAVDGMTIAECFTIAAMGAHYDMDCFPDRIRKMLYASATLHFNEKNARHDYLRTMRLLLAMSFYAVLEKYMSTRYLIAAGLHIARWKCVALSPPNTNKIDDGWRKVFRSLIFMDSWLSYTLGYTTEVTPRDIQIGCMPYPAEQNSIDELIHSQTSKIGLVAAEIAKALASPELTTRENISMLGHKLESWRLGIPTILQIPTLTSDNPPDLHLYQRRAILMVHVMYLGALVLLYRQLLVATAETHLTDGISWATNIPVHEARVYRDECAMAAQQMARIIGLIRFDGTLTKRCWLTIYWAFTASIVLLFGATTKLLDGQTDSVESDLDHANSCMSKLRDCNNFEPVAAYYLETLLPIYNSLRDKHQQMIGRTKTSLSTILQADPTNSYPPIALLTKEEMSPICEKLALLLTDPFGRKQLVSDDGNIRRAYNADGSCFMSWFK